MELSTPTTSKNYNLSDSPEVEPITHSSESQSAEIEEQRDNHPSEDHSAFAKTTTIIVNCVSILSTLALLAFVSFIATTSGKDIDEHYDRYKNALLVVYFLYPSSLNTRILNSINVFLDGNPLSYALCRNNESTTISASSMEAGEELLVRHTRAANGQSNPGGCTGSSFPTPKL